MVLLLESLSFIIKRVKHVIEVLDDIKRVLENGNILTLLENDQTVSTLIQSACNLLIQDHLTELLENLINWEADLVSDVSDLHFTVRLNDFLEVVL